MNYVETNLNPSGKTTGDCVVRAIMKATGKSWMAVYNDVTRLGGERWMMPNCPKVYHEYLTALGWAKQKMPRFPDNTRYTIREFADAKPKGTFIISVANHLTVVVDGTLYDTWDCSYKSVGNYWTKKKHLP